MHYSTEITALAIFQNFKVNMSLKIHHGKQMTLRFSLKLLKAEYIFQVSSKNKALVNGSIVSKVLQINTLLILFTCMYFVTLPALWNTIWKEDHKTAIGNSRKLNSVNLKNRLMSVTVNVVLPDIGPWSKFQNFMLTTRDR